VDVAASIGRSSGRSCGSGSSRYRSLRADGAKARIRCRSARAQHLVEAGALSFGLARSGRIAGCAIARLLAELPAECPRRRSPIGRVLLRAVGELAGREISSADLRRVSSRALRAARAAAASAISARSGAFGVFLNQKQPRPPAPTPAPRGDQLAFGLGENSGPAPDQSTGQALAGVLAAHRNLLRWPRRRSPRSR
jgi:hypothetical protein